MQFEVRPRAHASAERSQRDGAQRGVAHHSIAHGRMVARPRCSATPLPCYNTLCYEAWLLKGVRWTMLAGKYKYELQAAGLHAVLMGDTGA